MQQLSVTELAAWLLDQQRPAPLLLDVREPWEFETCHIPGAQLMPMQTIPSRFQELDPEQQIVCICHHGGRSMRVANFLHHQGFTQVLNLTGGVHAWANQVDESMPTY